MKEKEYLLIDSQNYSEYFLRELKDRYIPITTDIYLKSFFESQGIKTIEILEYLSNKEVKKIFSDVSLMVDSFVDQLDENNHNFCKNVFADEEVRFFYATMKYLFKRFVASSYKLLKGMDSIVQNNPIRRIFYLHDGSPQWLCGNREQHSFIFPDDVSWRIMQFWSNEKKPETILLKVPLRKPATGIFQHNCRNYLNSFKKSIKRIVRHSYEYSSSKKMLLFISPAYDLLPVLNSAEISRQYNVVTWDVDYTPVPNFLRGQSIPVFFKSCPNKCKEQLKFERIIEELNLNVEGAESLKLVKDFEFLSFITPLIRYFVEEKLPDILGYWKAMENFHKTAKVDILFWDNPPHRYPEGIIVEFCRINRIPVVGMQHGGVYGSNRMEGTDFDIDYDKCNSYFTYGFNNADLRQIYPERKDIPEIIPVGSTRIFDFVTTYSSKCSKRDRVKILYAPEFFQHFFWKSELIAPSRELFNFQKRIVDLLKLRTHQDKIILKFYPGSYNRNPLKPYLDSLGLHGLEIADNVPLRKILEESEVELILLDTCSTALNESCATKSNIIVYNDQYFAPLTEDAFRRLNRRAIVCNTQEDFFNNLKTYFDDKIPHRDLENREFLEKYGIFEGIPKENIRKGISHILMNTSLSFSPLGERK